MAEIADFIDQSTGQIASPAKTQAAVDTNNFGGLTPIDADGNTISSGQGTLTLSPALQAIKGGKSWGPVTQAGAPNYLLWALGAFAFWYFFLKDKR